MIARDAVEAVNNPQRAALLARMSERRLPAGWTDALPSFATEKDGKPNARIWVLKLLRDNFSPGDKIVEISAPSQASAGNPYVYSYAVVTKLGKHKLLLLNRRNQNFDLSVHGAAGGQLDFVDVTTGFQPAASTKLTSDNLTLHGFSSPI